MTDIPKTSEPTTDIPKTEEPATDIPETGEPATEQLSEDERAELERLRAERRPRGAARPSRRRFSWRSFVAIVLIVLGCVLSPIAVVGVWAGNQVTDTGRYVATVQPLIDNPAIQNVLTDKITNEITSQLNLTGLINQATAQLQTRGLPRISTLLTTFGPQITSAVTGFIHSTVHTVISSQAMAKAWVQVNTVAHQAVVKLLSGQGGGTLTSANGQITLNLGPLIAVVKQDLVARGFGLASNIPNVNPTVALFQAKDLGKARLPAGLRPQDRAAHPGACTPRRRGVHGAGPPPGPDRGGAGGSRVHGGPRHRLADCPGHLPEQRPRQRAAH